MLEILEKLLVIQDRDRRIAQLKQEAARIPKEITAADQRVAAESAKLASAKNEVKRIETERKKLELEAESKRQQVAKYKTQLNQIKSNVEYQALLKEITRAEDEIRRIEDTELELMERLEKLQPAVREEEVLLREVTAKGETEKQQLQKRSQLIAAELTQLQADRAALAAAIDPDVLHRYERILRSKGDAAIVPVRHGNCGGCHLNVPPQLQHDARNGTELISCNYCGRILYWQAE